ncbi:M56 family metallopeptidase [Stakelama sp. CBK3Z-3]|uniref:M56 family metallopeptidase n=1 Tax=Stakelama flava TaxID=2860338 RepID=A0ABS6XIE9_9SPHN|nr:M56 family metallopeptidase [Stakelama flava]
MRPRPVRSLSAWRKYVAFPADFHERYDEQERDLALAHELGHHVRGDLYANWAALVVLSLHWFNPIAWRAFRAFRADQEMACDALVLSGRRSGLRHAYGRAIVKSAHGGAVSAACHLHSIDDIKGRLKMLTKNDARSRSQIALGGSAMAVLVLAGLGLTASGSSAAEIVRGDTAVRIDARDLSEPPAAPVLQTEPVPAAPAGDVSPPPVPGESAKNMAKAEPVIVHNGEVKQTAELDAQLQQKLHNLPEVSEADCGAGTQTVKLTQSAGRASRMVICTDRIERLASDATARAMSQQEMAMASARAGLASARAAIAANADMAEVDKRAALAGIASAEAELKANGLSDD